MQYRLRTLLILLAIGPPLGTILAQVPSAKPKVSAPVLYESTMLVLVSDEGVAAVVFRPTTKGGAAYDFRYEGDDGKKEEGANRPLFESQVKDVKSELFIKVGPISIEWSRGGDDRGWVYYEPEKVALHLANASDFTDRVEPHPLTGTHVIPKLNLQRFVKRRMP